MPRFAITKYTPVKDSTPGLRTVDPQRLVLAIKYRGDNPAAGTDFGCPCGCGEEPIGKDAVFKMGHDARLRGKLIRAYLTDTEVVFVVGGIGGAPAPPLTAKQVAARYKWEGYLEHAAMAREGKNRQVLRSAIGSTRLIKVGRWEYTGQVVAVYGVEGDKEYDVEYVTKLGEVKKTRVPADQAPVAPEETTA